MGEVKGTEELFKLREVQGIGEASLRKLAEAGYTLEKVACEDVNTIAKLLSTSLRQAAQIVDSAKKLAQGSRGIGAYTASQYRQFLEENVKWYSTGSKDLDELLGGGFRSCSLTGITGPFESGKSQMVNTAIVHCIDKGEHAMLIETELDTAAPERFAEIAAARGLSYDPEKLILIDARKITSVEDQFFAYGVMREIAESQGLRVGILAVDSFTSCFQRKFRGREVFPDRKKELNRHITYLEDFARDFNCAVLLTAQVIEVPVSPQESKGLAMDSALVRAITGMGYIPWGGSALTHGLATWLSLEWTRHSGVYKAVLFGSSRQPKGKCYFTITDKGITDLNPKLKEAIMKRKGGEEE